MHTPVLEKSAKTMQGTSADLFCESFFETIVREKAEIPAGFERSEVERLRGGFNARLQAAVQMESLTDEEREAMYSGRLRTVSDIGALERDGERAAALARLTRWFNSCDARLAKQGVPAKPRGPEPGTSEWYLQNR